MNIKDENHITFQGWMRTQLSLKGNDLIVYAIIYGFSQTNEQKFTGSLQYLADWCGATKQGIIKNLKNLIDANLIEKNEVIKNGVKFCEYSCIPLNSVKHPIKLSLTNNIANNKEVSISKKQDIDNKKIKNSDSGFLGSLNSSKKPSLYTNCIELIDAFVCDNHIGVNIRDLLIQHLNIAFEQQKIRGKGQYLGILKKLQKIVDEGHCNYAEVINYSIEHGYPTFYEHKDNRRNKKIDTGNDHIESFTEEDEKKLYEFQKKCRKEGKRVSF